MPPASAFSLAVLFLYHTSVLFYESKGDFNFLIVSDEVEIQDNTFNSDLFPTFCCDLTAFHI